MPRRHTAPDPVNPQRWMVSYADFMTLLFAFFVVLYGASSLNNEKFHQMSQVFVGVFDKPASLGLPQDLQFLIPGLSGRLQESEQGQTQSKLMTEDKASLYAALKDVVDKTINKPRVNLQKIPNYVQLEIPADYIFQGRSSKVSLEGEYILSQLAGVLKEIPNFINIEVFTDDQPLGSGLPSWALAANQGVAILELLMLDDVSPLHLASVNYGPFQPIATNDDKEGRSINRRVLLLIHDNDETIKRIKAVTDAHLSTKP